MMIEFKSPINSEFVIVDNEISNDISCGGKEWDYADGKIICTGILIEDKIKIFFRKKEDDEQVFKDEIRKEMGRLQKIYDKFYAFNRNMELGNFGGFMSEDYEIEEIKAFKGGKGWTKQKFFDILLVHGKVPPESIPHDALNDNSVECIACYEREEYNKIIEHNKADLIKQAFLMKYKSYLLDLYKDKLDENGWIRR